MAYECADLHVEHKIYYLLFICGSASLLAGLIGAYLGGQHIQHLSNNQQNVMTYDSHKLSCHSNCVRPSSVELDLYPCKKIHRIGQVQRRAMQCSYNTLYLLDTEHLTRQS